jgi:hypothetical protein
MNRMKNNEVIARWALGIKGANHNGSLRTDGDSLWSYDLLIGARTRAEAEASTGIQLAVADYTTTGGRFESNTTSTHVNAAKRSADLVVEPERFDQFVIDFTV